MFCLTLLQFLYDQFRRNKNIIGFNGEVSFDDSKPNGAAKKLTDVSRLTNMGWNCNIKLHSGLSATYSWYIENNK